MPLFVFWAVIASRLTDSVRDSGEKPANVIARRQSVSWRAEAISRGLPVVAREADR